MNKQTVFLPTDKLTDHFYSNDIGDCFGLEKLESVYVLTDKELEGRDETNAIEFAQWVGKNHYAYSETLKIWWVMDSTSPSEKTTKELYQIFLTTH